MEPCVNCGTVEPVVPVPSCDCQSNPCPGGDQREIRLIAPTRHEYNDWVTNDPMLPEGVLALVKDRLFEGSVEYIIGDGEHQFSDLLEANRIYAGAPLSRTGAANHSPLAASGKSTLDPSWLPAATSNALGAVMVSTTGAAGKVPTPASGSSTLDSSWLPVSTSGAANKIPIADNNGKLDPSWLPAATSTTLGGVMASTTTAANNVVKADGNGGLSGWKDSIIDAIIAGDGSGGLATDENGNMIVDFDQMPTAKFEALLKSLKMLVPLESDKSFYVATNDPNASDTLDDNRGTEAKPFETIQACVNYVTQNYAVNNRTVTIYVKQGTYGRTVLPLYTRTTGSINIRAYDYTQPPTISNTGTASALLVNGGNWSITRFNITMECVDATDGQSKFVSAISVANSGTSLVIKGCSASVSYISAQASVYYRIHAISVSSNAYVGLQVMENYQNVFDCTKGNADLAQMFHLERNAELELSNSYLPDTGSNFNIVCNGTPDVCVSCATNSLVYNLKAGGTYVHLTGNMTGKRYIVTTNSGIIAPENGFPGTIAGTVETETSCWYSGDTGES